jgi:hypothetical protein
MGDKATIRNKTIRNNITNVRISNIFLSFPAQTVKHRHVATLIAVNYEILSVFE